MGANEGKFSGVYSKAGMVTMVRVGWWYSQWVVYVGLLVGWAGQVEAQSTVGHMSWVESLLRHYPGVPSTCIDTLDTLDM